MKKRRELDALVNGKLGKNRKTKKGGHELLHNESDSSEVEEFSLSAQKTVVRHGPSRLCATCVPLCGFFLLVACVVGVGGLVWVHIKLRNDLDQLRSQLRTVESGNKNTPDTFQQIHSKLKDVEDSVKRLQTDTGDQSTSLAAVKTQLGKLQGTSDDLQNKLKDSPALENLPKSFENLSRNVAGFGSELKSLQANVESLMKSKTDLQMTVKNMEERIKKLEASAYVSTTVAPSVASTAAPLINKYVQDHLDVLSHDLSLVNVTMTSHLTDAAAKIRLQQVKIDEIKNRTNEIQARLGLLELSSTSAASNKPNMSDIQTIISEAVNHVAAQLHNSSNGHQGADQALLNDLTNQIQNISSTLAGYKQQFDNFKSGWETGKLDHINLNMEKGFNTIIQKALQTYITSTQGQIQKINESLTGLSHEVVGLQGAVQTQQGTLSSLTSQASNATTDQGTKAAMLPPGGNVQKTAETSEDTAGDGGATPESVTSASTPAPPSSTPVNPVSTINVTSAPPQPTTMSSPEPTMITSDTSHGEVKDKEVKTESDKSSSHDSDSKKKSGKHAGKKSHKHHKETSSSEKASVKRSGGSQVEDFAGQMPIETLPDDDDTSDKTRNDIGNVIDSYNKRGP